MTLRKVLLVGSLLLFGIGAYSLGFAIYERAPPYTFGPFCTYDLTYGLNITIEVDGKRYSSSAVNQLSRSRKWIAEINSCPQAYGTAVAFRLANNRLVLLSSFICQEGIAAFDDTHGGQYPGKFANAMKERRKVELTSLCFGVPRYRAHA